MDSSTTIPTTNFVTPDRRPHFTLIGEEIEGLWNTEALADIAAGFGGRYLSLDTSSTTALNSVHSEQATDLLLAFDWLIAAENTPHAVDIYRCRLPAGKIRPALIVGNEAKGLRRGTLKRADVTVQIPILSKNINCLNVAAAAAVILHYLRLDRPLASPRRTLAAVQKNRPGLLLIGGQDHRELGSVIRSACAFGWDMLFLQDRYGAWYTQNRIVRGESRGTARRGRNPIRVIPFTEEIWDSYRKIIVFRQSARDQRLSALPLIGSDTLIVLQDERDGSAEWPAAVGRHTEILYAPLPALDSTHYHYHQTASIALAETARQLGQPDSDGIYLRNKRDRYRKETTLSRRHERAEALL